MKNLIKFILLFFIFILNFTHNVEAQAVVSTLSGVNCVIESSVSKQESSSISELGSDKTKAVIGKSEFSYNLSTLREKNNNGLSGGNKYGSHADNDLTNDYKHYISINNIRSSHKISPVLEYAIVTRAP